MSNELNERLRAALRPVDPGERFTQSVLARIARAPAATPMLRPERSGGSPEKRQRRDAGRPVRDRNAVEGIPRSPNGATRGNFGLPWLAATGLATCAALGLMIAHEHEAQHAEAGLEARRQVIEALRVTSEKLDLAYRVVKDKGLSGTEKRGA